MNADITQSPINELGFSAEVLQACNKYSIVNLDGFLKYTYTELMKMNGFDMRVLVEIITVLKKHNLQYRLKD